MRNWRKCASLHLVQCSPMFVMSQRNRLLHRVFITTQSPNRLHELPDGTFSLFAPNAPVARRIVSSSRREGDCLYCSSQVFTDSEASGFHDTSLQSNMKCDVYIRKELYAMSCCQVARPPSSADREIIRDVTEKQFHC